MGEAAGSEPGSDNSPEDTGEQLSWIGAMKGSRLASSLHTQEGPTFHWYPVCLAGF